MTRSSRQGARTIRRWAGLAAALPLSCSLLVPASAQTPPLITSALPSGLTEAPPASIADMTADVPSVGSLTGVTTEPARQSDLQVVLDEVDPVVPRTDAPVTLRGRVLNSGTQDVPLTLIGAHASWSALIGRDEVAGWVDGQLERETGWLLGQAEIGPEVGAGATVDFEITIPAEELARIPGDLAPLAVRLEVTHVVYEEILPPSVDDGEEGDGEEGDADVDPATPSVGSPLPDSPNPDAVTVEDEAEDGDDADEKEDDEPPEPLRIPVEITALSELRTVLSVSRVERIEQPLHTSWIVPLTLPGDVNLMSTDPATRVESWYAAVGPDSPSATWLSAWDLPSTTFLVDPALLTMLNPTPELIQAVPAGEGGEDDEPPDVSDEAEQPEPTPASSPTTESTTPSDSGPNEDSLQTTESPATSSPPGTDIGAPATQDPTSPASTRQPEPTPEPTSEPTSEPTTSPAPEPPPSISVDHVRTAQRELAAGLNGLPVDQLWWLPTDDLDVMVLREYAAQVDVDLLTHLLTRLPISEDTDLIRLWQQGRQDVIWPMLPSSSQEDLEELRDLWQLREASVDLPPTHRGGGELAAVIVPRETFDGAPEAPVSQAARTLVDDPLVMVGLDHHTRLMLADAHADSTDKGAGAVAQEFVADSLAAYLEDPFTSRSMVLAPERDTDVPAAVLSALASGLSQAPWLDQVSAQHLIDSADHHEPAVPIGHTADSGHGASAQGDTHDSGESIASAALADHPIDSQRAQSLSRIHTDLGGLAQIVQDTESVASWRPVVSGLWSTRWRADATGWAPTWRQARDGATAGRAAIHVNPSTVNFLADRGVIQVTVINDLPVGVQDVHLELVPDNHRLQIVDQPEPVAIGPGARATVVFTARAVTSGQTVITAHLTTPGGTTLGDTAEVQVRVQPTGGWIYWVLGGLAALLLVAGGLRAVRPTARRRGREGKKGR